MANFDLFASEQIVGVFRGFSKGGLEFHADLVLPYRNEFQNIPMHGQFLLVQLETEEEGVLGRITSLSSAGKLSSGVGEEFNIRAIREKRPIPEDLREQYLKYEVDIRVLGVLRKNQDGQLTFVASHRRLPHVGSAVAFLSDKVFCEIIGHNIKGAAIGHFALGEYIYASGSKLIEKEDWMQIKEPEVLVKFPITNLVSRRSFIFARAGFGKSNLNKLLFSELYKETPTVIKRGGKEVPVGTVLFDPDGEYFWPDDKGRPGLCDVPHLDDKLVVFTPREAPSEFYRSFIAGGIKLDIRRLSPSDVIAIALNPEKQDQQNVRKLKGLNSSRWRELVDLITQHKNQTPLEDIRRLLDLDDKQDIEGYAARANMTTIVSMLHDRASQLMDKLISALAQGKLCVIDISQMRGSQSLILSGIILRRIFDRNQQEFTAADSKTIPTLAVVEEAQAVLNERATGSDPYIAWVKEGRKYDLGAVLVTQQPGSIPNEILSQGDNWFIFHLLSAGDLNSIRNANAHFSQDILSALLNEPIPGQGIFWSSSSGSPFPIAIRVLSFEKMYKLRDPNYNKPSIATFAQELKKKFSETLEAAGLNSADGQIDMFVDQENDSPIDKITKESEVDFEPPDPLEVYEANAIKALRKNSDFMEKIKTEKGVHWRGIMEILKLYLPSSLEDIDDFAYKLVPRALDEILGGQQDEKWETYKNERGTVYARKI